MCIVCAFAPLVIFKVCLCVLVLIKIIQSLFLSCLHALSVSLSLSPSLYPQKMKLCKCCSVSKTEKPSVSCITVSSVRMLLKKREYQAALDAVVVCTLQSETSPLQGHVLRASQDVPSYHLIPIIASPPHLCQACFPFRQTTVTLSVTQFFDLHKVLLLRVSTLHKDQALSSPAWGVNFTKRPSTVQFCFQGSALHKDQALSKALAEAGTSHSGKFGHMGICLTQNLGVGVR